jgi:hypothetical protein
MDVALFGRVADGPLPALDGLLVQHGEIVDRLDGHDERIMQLTKDMVTLMERTRQLEPDGNGGATLADQVRKIADNLGIK